MLVLIARLRSQQPVPDRDSGLFWRMMTLYRDSDMLLRMLLHPAVELIPLLVARRLLEFGFHKKLVEPIVDLLPHVADICRIHEPMGFPPVSYKSGAFVLTVQGTKKLLTLFNRDRGIHVPVDD